jgi:hypothetical protein
MAAEKMKNMTAAELNVAMGMDADAYRPKMDTRDEVVAALRELMHLGPNDPTPKPAAKEDPKKISSAKEPGNTGANQ